MTNELDPDSPVVRLLLIGIMLATLLMAVAIPDAFGDRALLFAGSYVAHPGRPARVPHLRVGSARGRSSASAPPASSSGSSPRRALDRRRAASRQTRELLSGWSRSRSTTPAPIAVLPGPGPAELAPRDWDVETAHFAERFQLFVIIALGESIVLTGRDRRRTSTSTPRG